MTLQIECPVSHRTDSPSRPLDEHVLDPQRLGDHIDRLFRAAWAMCGSREEAEDLVQETYAQVLSRPRIIRRDDDIRYLLRALRNTFFSQLRTTQRRPQQADITIDELSLPDTRNPALDPSAAMETRELYALIAALPRDFRDALVAIDVVGLSYAEAAKSLGVRQGTVTSRLHRARGRLAASLSR